MEYFGECISLVVAVSWTVTAILAEIASKRLGASELNVIRMVFSLFMLGATLYIFSGSPFPQYMPVQGWVWLSLSGFVGYCFGDYCLFNAYLLIGSRFGQLLMTLSSVFAAISSLVLLGEQMGTYAILGMVITLSGIAMSVMNRAENDEGKPKVGLKLPTKGVLLGIGAAIGQGVGLVLSKVGMTYYEAAIPQECENVIQIIPFTSTMVRAITGLIGFVVLLLVQGKGKSLCQGLHDGKGMTTAVLMTMFGPFIGVSLSLMAVQYTAAGIASTIMATTPILILAPAYFIFHQRITWKEIVGACVSIVGVSLFFL